jgi:predicted RNA-binding Zn-ribbon protein involved in translation (DUF1610 family)
VLPGRRGKGYNQRMRRGLFNFCTALSLLILLATPALWWHSQAHRDELSYGTPSGTHGIVFVGGRCGYHFVDQGPAARGWRLRATALPAEHAFNRWSYLDVQRDPQAYSLEFLGLFYFHLRGHGEGRLVQLVIPDTYYIILAAILPILWLVDHNRRRRLRERRDQNLCATCGYDLRAHKPGDKCPECGTVIARAVAAANVYNGRDQGKDGNA